ncbi:hypothetical protein [Pseudomonas sp. PDM20]|uniref:hypothetical protein n=1 Tax=Pseudomonas sp. PDM20 TaxID=2769254 RepID=UPI00178373C6|nr:hypothetical protein [Pseudomonas sp. PDM20]MBD9683594.1 hypothetical protein [Pseudomonas sp. PDM20]
MEEFKVLVDVLSSIASLVAIVTVMYSWYFSRRPALEVSQAIVSGSDDSFRFIVSIKNKKPYPVLIKGLGCYRRRLYRVEKKKSEFPRLVSMLDLGDRIYSKSSEISISELGECRFEFAVTSNVLPLRCLVFMIDTSHGYLNLSCKNIRYLGPGVEVLAVDFMLSRESKISAFPIYIKGGVLYLMDLLPFKLTRLRRLVSPKRCD